MVFGEKSSILGSKSHIVVSHHSILPTLLHNVGDGIRVVGVSFG